jgi:NAD(P)-dependent dehydrogenase (short-subunit alcohol dehydrogenase family)
LTKSQPLRDRVAVVTGASRGAGKGIAVVLGGAGARVYVTGRSVRGGQSTLGRPGTIDDTADEVTRRGGVGIAVRCDHTVDDEVEALFRKVVHQSGRLDILVNNAWGGYEIDPDTELPFWQIELRHWDLMFDAGVRAQMTSSRFAVPLMLEKGRGLIVNTTWVLGTPHGNAFYEVAKTASHRLTASMADDLREAGIAVVAVSPGFMRGERMNLSSEAAAQAESTEYVGRAVTALAADPQVIEKSGRLLTVVELAREYGFTDIDGRLTTPFWERYYDELARTHDS